MNTEPHDGTAIIDARDEETGQHAADITIERLSIVGALDAPARVFDDDGAKRALEQIFALEDEAQEAERVYEQAAKRAKSAKDDWTLKREELDTLIRRYRDESRGVEPTQPRLKTVAETLDEPIDARRKRMADEAKTRNLFIDASDLDEFTREELDTLELWIRTPGPVPPELLTRAHRVTESVDGSDQLCAVCGIFIAKHDDAYNFGSLVGMDCTGAPPEVVKGVFKRRSKKRKKADPEAERAQQREDGAARDTAHVASEISAQAIQACTNCGLVLAHSERPEYVDVGAKVGDDCPGVDLSADAPVRG